MVSCQAVTQPIYLTFPGTNLKNSMLTITIHQMHGMLPVKTLLYIWQINKLFKLSTITVVRLELLWWMILYKFSYS